MELAGISIIGIIHVVLVVWAVIDLLSSRRSGCATILWLLLIILLPWLGPILYLLLGRYRAV
jgi:hypothetical protein